MCRLYCKGSDYSTHSPAHLAPIFLSFRAANRVVLQVKMMDGTLMREEENFPRILMKIKVFGVNKKNAGVWTADVVNHPAHYPKVTIQLPSAQMRSLN